MLMHTRGILVMTPESAMVLTGKQALDYSGGVSAEDNFGIGGYERIMGPNGEAQYWAPDLIGARRPALRPLRAHLRGPRRAVPPPGAPPRTPSTATCAARRRHDGADGGRVHRGRRHLLRRPQRRPQEALRHALADAGHDRPGPPAARALGRRCATPRPRSSTTPTSAASRPRSSASSRGRCPATAPSPPTGPTSGRRARCSRCRRRRWPGPSTRPAATARWWCWPTCPASTVRPSRCAGCSSSTAPRSAGPS